MIGNDWCRTHINKQVDRIKRMFKWATENELVPGTVYESLRCVAGLKRGRTEVREGRKLVPISDTDIAATLEHLPEVVADMVQLQRLMGARPGELCDIRPGDINRSGDVWEYIPASHKTEHHDRPRVIFIGAKGQRVLLPYLLRATDSYAASHLERRKANDVRHNTRPARLRYRAATSPARIGKRIPGVRLAGSTTGIVTLERCGGRP
jgi:integrase